MDFSRAQNVGAQFLTPALKRHGSDPVWRLPLDQGQERDVFLLLEFPSRPQRTKAQRMTHDKAGRAPATAALRGTI